MSEPRKRLTYANVVSTLCLVLVVGGGTAFAAGLGPNTVGSAQIKDGQVKLKDLGIQSVNGTKVKNDSLTGKDINEKTLSIAAYGNAKSDYIDDFTTGTYASIVSVNFTAPTAGVVLLVGSVGAQDDVSLAGNGNLLYQVAVDGVNASNNTRELEFDAAVSGAGESGAVTAVIPVAAGGHTASLVAKDDGTGSFIFAREISAVFIPHGSGFAPLAKVPAKRMVQPQ